MLCMFTSYNMDYQIALTFLLNQILINMYLESNKMMNIVSYHQIATEQK